MMNFIERIKARHEKNIISFGWDGEIPVFTIRKSGFVDFVRYLKERDFLDFDMLTDITAVDYLQWKGKKEIGERFEAVYHLFSVNNSNHIRVKVPLAEDESIPSLTFFYAGADWAERECYDLFGIRFDRHPDMRRIIMPDSYPWHPLRKDQDLNPEGLDETLVGDLLLEGKNGNPPASGSSAGEEGQVSTLEPADGPFTDAEGYTILNLGPSHPATHGILRNILKLDGETVVDAEPTIGYVHRCFEKLGEGYNYNQFLICTDRLNYVSSPMNNIGWLVAVEEMLGLRVPERAQYVRVVINELARISDHMVCLGILGVDLGAFTPFLYLYHQRENIYKIFERLCGARLTTTFGRVGGLELDIYPDFERDVLDLLQTFRPILRDFDGLLTKNRIFIDRTLGVGAIEASEAISYGFTGPNLRAAGVPYDIRKSRSYLTYDDFEFDIPVGKDGSVYYRYLVRLEEMKQSIRIIEHAVKNIPEGPFKVDAPRIVIPDKREIYEKMDALIFHFEIMQKSFSVPEGEHYSCTEAANGELGFYIVSEGGERPYRVRIRRPCFYYYQSFPELIRGGMIGDAIAIMSSLNVIAGELDG